MAYSNCLDVNQMILQYLSCCQQFVLFAVMSKKKLHWQGYKALATDVNRLTSSVIDIQ